MNPISESLLMQIAQGLEGYRSYLDIDVSSVSERPELAWIAPDDIAIDGKGFIFYYETIEQARALREQLGQSGYTNCRATSNGLPVTFVCLSDEFNNLYG